MSFSTLIFLVVFVPVAFMMLVWAVATACRLYFPRRPLPFFDDAEVYRRWRHEARARSLPVGVREIRAAQLRVHRERVRHRVDYVVGDTAGLPKAWHEDLWARRN